MIKRCIHESSVLGTRQGTVSRLTAGMLIVTLAYSPLLSALASAQTPPVQNTVTQFEYDATGNLTKRIDPRSKATTMSYDTLDRLIQQVQPLAPTGTTPTVTMGYDGQDQIKSVTDPRSLMTTYTRTGLGDQTKLVSPDTGITDMTFDAAGNMVSRKDARNKTVLYTYDAQNRLTKIDYPTGVDTLLEYDGGTAGGANTKGRLTKVTDESGMTTYSYDSFGRVLVKTQTIGTGTTAKVRTVSYAYGAAGVSLAQMVSMTYPSGNRVNYSYASNGRVSTVTMNPANNNGIGTNTAVTVNLLTSITYQPSGAVTGWVWGNNTAAVPSSVTRTYDLDGRLTSFPLGHPAQSGLVRTVAYDEASRITGYTHVNGTNVAQPTFNHSFSYDDLNRLTGWTQNTTTQAYVYDNTGNRTSHTIGATTYTHVVAATSNKLTSVSGPAPAQTNAYDAAGNLTGNGTATFTYSDRGRMATAKVGTNTVTYKLNALEQRVSKTGPAAVLPSGAAYYAYDEQGQLLGQYDANLTSTYETVYLGTTPVAVLTQTRTGTSPNFVFATAINYAYADQIDTIRAIIRASDNKFRWRWDQAEPFGTSAANSNPAALGVFTFTARFPGQVYDQETNLHYNWNRDYDPRIGKYIQSDPIGLAAGTTNTFEYVESNPLTFVDLQGLVKDSVSATIEAAISRGNTQTLQTLVESGGLNLIQQQAASLGIQRLETRAADLIARELRGSVNQVFPGQLRDKTLAEIIKGAREGDKACQTAKKLLTDGRFTK